MKKRTKISLYCWGLWLIGFSGLFYITTLAPHNSEIRDVCAYLGIGWTGVCLLAIGYLLSRAKSDD